MKKSADKLGGYKTKKAPERGTRELDKRKDDKQRAPGKIQAGVKARAERVVEEKVTVTRERKVSVRAEVSADKKGQKKKVKQKRGAEKLSKKAAGEDAAVVTETAPAVEVALPAPLDSESAPPPSEAAEPATAQKQEFEKIARVTYTAEELTEFEELGIPLDVAGQYVFVIQRNPDGSPLSWRKWFPAPIKKFIDAAVSADIANFYTRRLQVEKKIEVYSDDVIEREKNKQNLPLHLIEECPDRLRAKSVKFYAQHFEKHKEITWEDIPKYPAQFTPKQVEWLVYAGVRPENSLERAELFDNSAKEDLFTPEQMTELRQGKVPAEVRIAYNDKYGVKWSDEAILLFAEHRAKPALVASYPKEFTRRDRIRCLESFVTSSDIDRYPEWTAKYEDETADRIIILAKYNADSKLSRQVYEIYEKKEERYDAWRNLEKLMGAKKPLDHVLKYFGEYIIPAEYIISFINKGVSPETVNDYIAKIKRVNYGFICECGAAGMTADDAKLYYENGFEKRPADAVALWRAKISADEAKPYQTFYYSSEGYNCSHTPSGEEIVCYVKNDASPEVAALLRKADFTGDELAEAQRQVQKAKTRSKIFKVIGGILVVAAAIGIGYKACGSSKKDAEKEKDEKPAAAQGAFETGEQADKRLRDTADEAYVRERTRQKGIPFMNQREAIASGKIIRDSKGEWVIKAGYEWVGAAPNWAVKPAPASAHKLDIKCRYYFTPTQDGRGKVKADCPKLDNEELDITETYEDSNGRRVAKGVITGTDMNGNLCTCENADFLIPQDRTQPVELESIGQGPLSSCKYK